MSSNLFAGVPPSSFGAGGQANQGLDFVAQHTGTCLGIWWFHPPSNGPASVTAVLYDTETQAVVATQVGGVMTPNAWNLIGFPAPPALTPGRLYTATICATGGGGSIGFTTGGLNAHFFNDPLFAPRNTGRFVGGTTPAFPASFSAGDRYGVDVEFNQTPTCPPCPTCPDCSFCPCNSPVTGPDAVTGILSTIVDCAYAAIDHTGGLSISRKGVVLGEVAWDDCMCGQLVLTEQRRYPSSAFPAEEVIDDDNCGPPWLVTVYSLSLARCVPNPDENGVPPDVTLLQAAAVQLNKDMSAIRRGVSCCLASQFNQNTLAAFQVGAQEINGPQGGCLETTLQILLGTPQNCEC